MITLDLSGSNQFPGGGSFGHVTGAQWTRAFLQELDSRMDGSISGTAGAGVVQVSLSTWGGVQACGMCSGFAGGNFQISPMSTNASALWNMSTPGFGQPIIVGTADEYDQAIIMGMQGLNNFAGSTLGDRSGQANYKRLMIVLTDATQPNACTSNTCFGCSTNINNDVWNVGTLAGTPDKDVETIIIQMVGATPGSSVPNAAALNILGCMVQNASNAYVCGPNDGDNLGTQIANSLCVQPPTCDCPPGFERVSTVSSGTAPPYQVYAPGSSLDCDKDRNGICRKIECECNVLNLPNPGIPMTQTGECDSITESYNESLSGGNPLYINPLPLTCHYDYECCLDATFEKGGIWKHNDRCDLYSNYYGKDHPWEVEWVEAVGQTVNTVRSIEYQLESYIYKGNLGHDCGDRFHDLDWNFDEAIIHNTEQVSGILSLTLDPKNDVPLITQYPIITGNDIEILYSKVEQKYRFNQFWDITKDRGEFDPNANASIFITQLNGYIRDLNQANLNYFKPAFQRKKFRHYWNSVILRKNISGNRKMLLKLANTKINMSFR